MVGTLLDVAEEDGRETPAAGELANLRATGLASRFGLVGRAIPRALRDRVSAIAIGTGAALSLWAIPYSVTNAVTVVTPPIYWSSGAGTTFGPFVSLAIILFALWILAFVTAMIGMPRVTRVLLVATIPMAFVARFLSDGLGMNVYPTVTFAIVMTMLALLGLVGRPAPVRRWRLWLLASVVISFGVLTFQLYQWHSFPSTDSFFFFEQRMFIADTAFIQWMVVAAPVVAILCLLGRRWIWAAVAMVTSLPYFAVQLDNVFLHGSVGEFGVWALIVVVVAAAAAAVGLRAAGFRITVTRR